MFQVSSTYKICVCVWVWSCCFSTLLDAIWWWWNWNCMDMKSQLGVPPTQTPATVRASYFGLCQRGSCNRSAVRPQEFGRNRIGEQEALFAEAKKTIISASRILQWAKWLAMRMACNVWRGPKFAPGGQLQTTECDLSCLHCCPLGGRARLHFFPWQTQKVFVCICICHWAQRSWTQNENRWA